MIGASPALKPLLDPRNLYDALPDRLPAREVDPLKVRALAEEFIRGGHTVIGCGRGGDAIFDLRMTHQAPHDFSVVDVALDTKVAIWAARDETIAGINALAFAATVGIAGAAVYLIAKKSGARRAKHAEG